MLAQSLPPHHAHALGRYSIAGHVDRGRGRHRHRTRRRQAARSCGPSSGRAIAPDRGPSAASRPRAPQPQRCDANAANRRRHLLMRTLTSALASMESGYDAYVVHTRSLTDALHGLDLQGLSVPQTPVLYLDVQNTRKTCLQTPHVDEAARPHSTRRGQLCRRAHTILAVGPMPGRPGPPARHSA